MIKAVIIPPEMDHLPYLRIWLANEHEENDENDYQSTLLRRCRF
jgi:hypothetical protein